MNFLIYSAKMGTHTVPTSLMDKVMEIVEVKEMANRTMANVIWVIRIDTTQELLDLLKRYSPDGATIFPAGAIHNLLPAIALDDSSNPVILVTESTAEPTSQDPWAAPSVSTN